jgi:hypothetical protein
VITHDGAQFFKDHTPWARLVLQHTPQLYNPDFLIFVERSPKRGLPMQQALPVAFLDLKTGDVRKLLCNANTWAKIESEFLADHDWLTQVRRSNAHRSPQEPFYVHPPRGALRARPATLQTYRDYHTRWGHW